MNAFALVSARLERSDMLSCLHMPGRHTCRCRGALTAERCAVWRVVSCAVARDRTGCCRPAAAFSRLIHDSVAVCASVRVSARASLCTTVGLSFTSTRGVSGLCRVSTRHTLDHASCGHGTAERTLLPRQTRYYSLLTRLYARHYALDIYDVLELTR